MSTIVKGTCQICGEVSVSAEKVTISLPRDRSNEVTVSFWDEKEHPVRQELDLNRHRAVIKGLVESDAKIDIGDVDAEVA